MTLLKYALPFYSPPLENKTVDQILILKKIIIMGLNYSYFQPLNSNISGNEFSKSGSSLS